MVLSGKGGIGQNCNSTGFLRRNRPFKHLKGNHEDMTNNEHMLIKKNLCNTGSHFVTRKAKQCVSYAIDLIQALYLEHVTFSFKNNHRNII